MKRSKKLYLLSGVLIVACLAAFAALRAEERQEQIKNSGEVILELDSASVRSLAWDYEGASLAFHRDGVWLYDGDEDFPVDGEKIGELLEPFETFSASFVIEEVEDYGQYGLDDPLCTIRLTTEDESYEILLGDYSTMDEQRYVSIGDGRVYLVSHDPLDEFDAVLSDLIRHDEIPDLDQVTEIRFSGAEEYTITYEEDSAASCCADDVYFTLRSGETLPLDTSNVNSYLSDIEALDLTDYVTYNVTEEELQSFGLDTPELTVAVEYGYENEAGEEVSGTLVLAVSRDPAERAAAEDAAEEDAVEEDGGEEEETVTAYARVGDSRIVYRLSSEDYRALMAAGYDELRHEEVLTADFADITQIDITLEGAEYTLTAQGEGEDKTWYYQDGEIGTEDLQDALEGLTADGFTGEQPADKREICLTVHLDNENFPEVRIELYRYDGSSCLAVVDGETVCFVSRSDVVELIEAVNAIVLS